ncbi:tyrocidine synthetase 1 [Nannizzia gypsea CBS 118893]|uniref:Tyrocidine synthetase 1 n=1 Tax=Arthroderma gypseum (strain ATCC MYA-4604 / CBS 118893) TaxID=535722 RepID=E4UNB4_ARTGP|nr:tyrocidine synthetase 1 [Nannizzia gypsea CBS 118893]EFQ99575.1 tyrocidine synthetase 1 [Nannizzia gypsea CBS 118893]
MALLQHYPLSLGGQAKAGEESHPYPPWVDSTLSHLKQPEASEWEGERFDLTPVQRGILTSIGSGAAWSSFTFDIPEQMVFSIDRLRMSWQATAAHHPILRTIIVSPQGHLGLAQQLVVPQICPMRLGPRDPYPKTLPYLVYQEEYQTAPSVTLHYHRALLDSKSLILIRNDFELFFRGYAFPTRIPFSEYARTIIEASHAEAEAFWETYLDGYQPRDLLRVSAALTDSTVDTTFPLNLSLLTQVEGFAQANFVQSRTIFLAAWAITVSRHLESNDVAFYTNLRASGVGPVHDIVGPLGAIAPVRLRLSQESSALDLFSYLSNEEKKASEYSYIGGQKICEIIGGKGSAKALLQTAITVLEADTPRHLDCCPPAVIHIRFASGHREVTIVHESCIPAARVEILLQHFWEALRELTVKPTSPLSGLDLVSEVEKSTLLSFKPTISGVLPQLVHHLIEERVALKGDDIALQFEKSANLTFSQLNMAANRVARQLLERMPRQSIIPVHMHVSINFIIALLAILKAGSAYVILDPVQPTARKEYIVQDTGAPFYISQLGDQDMIPGVTALFIEDLVSSSGEDTDLDLVINTESPAYVIYTSGSTGNPKGVVLSHRAASIGIICAPTSANTRSLLFYNPIFSAAQRTILSTLAKGGCLCLASRSKLQTSLADQINGMEVDTLGITSSFLTRFNPEYVPTLKRVTLTGEAPNLSVIDRWAASVELRNNYGLSECTQLNWGQVMSASTMSPHNVGFPADSTAAFVLEPGTFQMAPFLVPGELCLQGPQLASGYLNRPELTAKAFVDSPFTPGQKLYRTGDLAVRLEDGSVEIIGRIDFQTKINGQRVEPNEIAAMLRKQNGVHNVAVVTVTVEGEKALVACVSPNTASLAWSQLVGELRKAALSNLPRYMTPAYWISFNTLPVNASGKIDIMKLREQVGSMSRAELVASSASSTGDDRELSSEEKILQSAWTKALQIPTELVTATQSFLALGGDSLKALVVISELLSSNYIIELGDILQSDSLATAALRLRYGETTTDAAPAAYSMLPDHIGGIDHDTYEDIYPATALQEGILSAHQTVGGYVYHRIYRIRGVDIDRLRRAFQTVIATDAIYRTSFKGNGAAFLQMVHKKFELPWDVVSGVSPEEYISQHPTDDIDITAPPIRAAVLDQDVMVVAMHHALFDFWSSRFLFEDVTAEYHGQPRISRPPFNVFVRHLQQNIHEADAAIFWSGYLKEAGPTHLTAGEEFSAVNRMLNRDLRALTTTLGVSIGALVYAAWSIILWKHTGNTDVTFAITLSGRDTPIKGIQTLSGPTLTVVPLRVQLQPSTMRLIDVARMVQKEIWKVAQHSQFGLRKALQAASQSPKAFNSMVNFLLKREVDKEKAVFQPYAERPIWNTGYTSLEVEENELGQFELRLSGQLDPMRADFIIDQVGKIFEDMASGNAICLSEMEIIGSAESAFLRTLSQPVSSNARLLHDGFEAIVASTGDRVAIEFENGDNITYRELNSRANQLARFLVTKGVSPDSLVPICLPKSIEMITSILAILKAGGAFVPLDPDNPPERNNFIVRDVSAAIVLTNEHLLDIFDEARDRGVQVEDVYNIDVSCYPSTNLLLEVLEPSHLAYTIYTSGSTGVPKGVLVSHSSIASGIESIITAEHWEPNWRVLQFSNYVFDVAVGDIFCTLSTGAILCMASMESLLSNLAHIVNKLKVDRLFLTPTVAKLIQPKEVPGVQGIYLAGEPVTPDLVETWAPHCHVMNCYGPTEAAILAVAGTIEHGMNSKVIGHPLKNCISMILEPGSMRLSPYGAVGELCLSGPQLARGYLNRRDVTDKAFVVCDNKRVYRTGDLARWIPNYRIECFGRQDNQVKVSGHRIELGEIENAIITGSGVQQAVVSAVEIQEKMHLVAFCVADPTKGQGILHPEEYLDMLITIRVGLTSLPPYMVPTIWIPVGAMPLLPSGKVNRKKLVEWIQNMDSAKLQQYSNSDALGEFVHPVSDQEKLLQKLWANLLNKDITEISAVSPFFLHGGDSISAINLVSKCKGHGYILAVSDVLAYPSLKDMAARMRPVSRAQNTVEKLQYDVPDSIYATLARAGVSTAEIKVIYPAVPGVEDFLTRGAKEEQFWQCQTVRPLPDILDFDRWIQITTELTARNEILRSMWLQSGHTWLQVVMEKPTLDLEIINCSSEQDKQAQFDRTWNERFEIGKPFIRYRLFVLPDGTRDLLIKIHHAMYDGTLLRIFDDEFKALYKGQPLPPTVSFRDYVDFMHSTSKAKSMSFWKGLLQGNTALFPTVSNPIASKLTVTTADRRVDSFAAVCGVTVSIVFQTAFTLLLSRLNVGCTDITYDNLITGRNLELENAQTIAGTCANFLPFRSTFADTTGVRELLRGTQSLFWETTENGNVSLDDIYKSLGQNREESTARALFLFQPFDAPAPTANLIDKHMRWMVMGLSKVRMPIDYALHLEVSKTLAGYNLRWKFDPRVYPVEEFERVTENYADILAKMMAHSRSSVASIL